MCRTRITSIRIVVPMEIRSTKNGMTIDHARRLSKRNISVVRKGTVLLQRQLLRALIQHNLKFRSKLQSAILSWNMI